MRNRASRIERTARGSQKKIYIYIYVYIDLCVRVCICIASYIILLTKRAVGLASGAPHVRIEKIYTALNPALPIRSTINHSPASRTHPLYLNVRGSFIGNYQLGYLSRRETQRTRITICQVYHFQRITREQSSRHLPRFLTI